MSDYPVTYVQRPAEQRNRLTVFFRFFMLIPLMIWSLFYGVAFFFVVFAAWFAIVFTGRWPQGMYDFAAGYLRFSGRVLGYSYLITDEYPPFDGGEHPEYPVRIIVAPPKDHYSRAKALFRFFLAIPIYILQYFISLWLYCVAIAIWFVAVFTGTTSGGLMEAMRIPMAYYVRATAYFYLITEDWPDFDPGPQAATA